MAKKKGRVARVGGSYPGPDIEDRVFAGLPAELDPDDPEAIFRGWIDFEAGDTLADLSPRVEASLAALGVFRNPTPAADDDTGVNDQPADNAPDAGRLDATEPDLDLVADLSDDLVTEALDG